MTKKTNYKFKNVKELYVNYYNHYINHNESKYYDEDNWQETLDLKEVFLDDFKEEAYRLFPNANKIEDYADKLDAMATKKLDDATKEYEEILETEEGQEYLDAGYDQNYRTT